MTILNAKSTWVKVWVVMGVLLLSSCASLKPSTVTQAETGVEVEEALNHSDPFESVNRKIFAFNDRLDKAVLKTVATAYTHYIPKVMRRGVSNFFANLWEPNTMVNALLQGKADQFGLSTSRFLVNSTLGLLGVFDVATPLGMEKQKEDFGQTLAVWGVNDGPYLVLPFFGPSNMRDFGGLILQTVTTDMVSPLFDGNEQIFASGLRLLDTRTQYLGADETLDLQVDPYLFLRESYRQSRALAIFDGVLPAASLEDEFEAELFDE